MTTETPIGKFTTLRPIVAHVLSPAGSYNGERLLLNQVIYPAEIRSTDGKTERGFSSTQTANPDIMSKITERDCLLYPKSYQIFSIDGYILQKGKNDQRSN